MSISSKGCRLRFATILSVLAISAAPAIAQGGLRSQITADDLGGILVGVAVPEDNPIITPGLRDLLTTRLAQIATSGGLSGVGVRTRFLMVPRVTVLESTTLDGTMQRQVASKVEIALEVRDATTRVPIQQVVLQRSGIGQTEERAIIQAISALRGDSPELQSFATSTRERLVSFYERQCTAIRREAGAHARAGRRSDALALLFSVPMASTTCHSLAMDDVVALMGERKTATPPKTAPQTVPQAVPPPTSVPPARSAAIDRARTDVVAYFNARRIANTDVVRELDVL
ncbi:MAG: hypothetical protein IBJ03_10765 [Gemmatimonadaceae bacterium]|nr:hypothetical protein [Gemmatimonadaceae bacterium]